MLTRSTQITESHCGPAVLQMLLSNLGIKVSQRRITTESGVAKSIKKYGIRVDQMAKAIKKAGLEAALFYKRNSNIDDISKLIELGFPVGIEWQGMFYEKEDEEEPGYDYGHYSIVEKIDFNTKTLVMIDPYKDFSHQDRRMAIEKFDKRWKDENLVIDPKTKMRRVIQDKRLLFVIAHNKDNRTRILREMGLKRAR